LIVVDVEYFHHAFRRPVGVLATTTGFLLFTPGEGSTLLYDLETSNRKIHGSFFIF
jgi:hypothetical protein